LTEWQTALSAEVQLTEKENDGGALPRRRYVAKIVEGLEHSRVLGAFRSVRQAAARHKQVACAMGLP